jgi:ATP-dependent Clp protease ATP-binding subunit ClpA
MLSNTLELTLRKALDIAASYKHEYATYEHLLLALMDDEDVKLVLIEKGINPRTISKKLSAYLNNYLGELVNENIKEPKPTAGFQRIVQRAVLHSQTNGQKSITGVNVLAEFFFENNSYALTCLKQARLKRGDVLNYNNRNKDSTTITDQYASKKQLYSDSIENSEFDIGHQLQTNKNLNTFNSNQNTALSSPEIELQKYCINLNTKANKDDIDCLIGRQTEIQRTIEILCRRKKNNALLIGESGVGKTAIAEGLAIRIVRGDVPDLLKQTVIYSLDIGSLVAGTKFRGDFEERIKGMLECLRKLKNVILFIDEIHSIIGAGSTTSGALDKTGFSKWPIKMYRRYYV